MRDNLFSAIRSVHDGVVSVNEAARQFDIPRITLQRRLAVIGSEINRPFPH